MSRSSVLSRPRASSQSWPRVAVLALVGVAAAGCSNSGRFDSNPFASNRPAAPPQETTGSIAPRPATSNQVVSQPLPAPSQPATVAASGGIAHGAQGLGAYRPGTTEITGSVQARPAPAPVPTGHWTWDGGSPVTVGRGETVETIARKHGVPASAIMETNGFRDGATLRPGQRVVIPRYVSASASQTPALHGRPVAATPAPQAPKVAQPRTVAVEKVASVPVQNARIATPETHPTTESVSKTAEAEGSLPSFRWPVKGRIIAAFGAKANGAQNDGINLAVPEGTPIKAADDGVVAYAGNELKGYGNLVLVRHANGYVSAYANASELLVKRGDTIKRGQVIANAGQTGNVTSPQLHFEIRKGSTPVDPAKYLGGA